jgi:MoaA/NifB/PqqE/SkfB family radical SAM enzyme
MPGKTNISGTQKPTEIISGLRAKWIRLRLLSNILYIALFNENNPFRAIRSFRAIREKRKKIHGLPRITRFVKCNGRYFWAENTPGWPSMNLNKFIKGEMLRSRSDSRGKVPLHTLIFAITNRCWLQCLHCYEWDNLQAKEHIEIDDLLEILNKMKLLGMSHVQFSGGEPLIRFNDLITLIGKAKSSMDCWILTSGFGLTREKASQLRKAGLTGAIISLDHWDEMAHNNFRNNNESYNWACEAAKNCREEGILISLSLCATKEFISEENLNQYLELAKKWGAGFVRVLEPRKTGRYRGQEIMLDDEKIELLERFYLQTNLNKIYRDYPIVMYPGYHQRRAGCFGAGNRYIYIDSKGDIHACPFCQNAAGNVLRDSMDDAISKLRRTGCQEFSLNTSY